MAVVLAKDLGLEADGIMDEDATSVPLDEMMVGRIAEHAGEVVEKLWHRSLGVRHAHHATGGGTRVIEVSRKEMRRGRIWREHPGHCRIATCGGFANATGGKGHQRLHLAMRKEGNLAGHGAFLCGYQSNNADRCCTEASSNERSDALCLFLGWRLSSVGVCGAGSSKIFSY